MWTNVNGNKKLQFKEDDIVEETEGEIEISGTQSNSSTHSITISDKISLLYRHLVTPSAAAAAAKSLQSCPTLCDPTDGSPPGSPVPGILQAGTPEWVAIPSSNERK